MVRKPKLKAPAAPLHMIAETFWDPQALLGAKPASSGSRDFH